MGACFPEVAWPWAPLLAGAAAFGAGAAWGAIPGWLRARRGAHEVINTIMLNFVATGLASWVTLYLLKNPDSQNPETRDIGAGYFIGHLEAFGDAPDAEGRRARLHGVGAAHCRCSRSAPLSASPVSMLLLA